MSAIASVGVGGPIPRRGRVAFWLSGALAVIAAASALATFLLPGILRGPAVMKRLMRDCAHHRADGGAGAGLLARLVWRGSARAVLAWLGVYSAG